MSTDDQAAMAAAMKEAMMPQLDAALAAYASQLSGLAAAAAAAEIDRCIDVVNMCRPKDAPRAWSQAIDFAIARLKDWKDESAGQPNGATPKEET